MSLAAKMAGSVPEVEQLLEELRAAALPVAQRELEELQGLRPPPRGLEAEDLKPWDVSYWAEVLPQGDVRAR